jgi:CheY-like chemotaxis protein
MSILVIEDDTEVRGCVSMMLHSEGFTVEAAADGAEALAYLRTHAPPNLILLDLTMRGMDGLEFRRQQLADPRIAKIPVIVLSGRKDGAKQARELAAVDFLTKPVNLEELIHVVQNQATTVPRSEHFLRGALRSLR